MGTYTCTVLYQISGVGGAPASRSWADTLALLAVKIGNSGTPAFSAGTYALLSVKRKAWRTPEDLWAPTLALSYIKYLAWGAPASRSWAEFARICLRR